MSRPTTSFDRPGRPTRFSTYVGALIGLGMPGLRGRDAMPDLTKLHFAGLLANQTRHSEGLAAILSVVLHHARAGRVLRRHLAWSCKRATTPGWAAPRRRAGSATALLLGGRVWSRQHKFRLVFGPLSLEEYERLLPGGSSFHKLVPIVRNYAGDVLAWDVRFVLRRREVPDTRLGQQGRLGWTTWLKPRRSLRDAADLVLDAGADSVAQKIDGATKATREREMA